jgi:hypothetical protein
MHLLYLTDQSLRRHAILQKSKQVKMDISTPNPEYIALRRYNLAPASTIVAGTMNKTPQD